MGNAGLEDNCNFLRKLSFHSCLPNLPKLSFLKNFGTQHKYNRKKYFYLIFLISKHVEKIFKFFISFYLIKFPFVMIFFFYLQCSRTDERDNDRKLLFGRREMLHDIRQKYEHIMNIIMKLRNCGRRRLILDIACIPVGITRSQTNKRLKKRERSCYVIECMHYLS